jgi:hypothetical protein
MLDESQMADTRYWVMPPDGSASTKRCLELNYDAAKGTALAIADCSADKKSVICQVSNSYNTNALKKIVVKTFCV